MMAVSKQVNPKVASAPSQSEDSHFPLSRIRNSDIPSDDNQQNRTTQVCISLRSHRNRTRTFSNKRFFFSSGPLRQPIHRNHVSRICLVLASSHLRQGQQRMVRLHPTILVARLRKSREKREGLHRCRARTRARGSQPKERTSG